MNPSATSTSTANHWVESLFPAQYSIGDYRATFQPDQQRVRRYITTLSTFDGPTLAAIYEQSYLFTLVQRLAQQDEKDACTSQFHDRGNQTQPIDSVLDIGLIRAYLDKHKENADKIDCEENLWTSDELVVIRSAYMKIRDDCLRLKSANEYYQAQMARLQQQLDETSQYWENLQGEHLSLKKVHTRWTLRTNLAEQVLDEQRRENHELIEHVNKLSDENDALRRRDLQMQALVSEKQTSIEQLQRRIDHYDRTLKQECERRIDLVEKRAQVDKDRFHLEQNQLKTKLDQEQDLRRQNLLALDQLRKHVALANSSGQDTHAASCDLKHVKYV
jgi:hypothetical protein